MHVCVCVCVCVSFSLQSTNRVEIDLSSLICFNISVSYATLNIQGVSQFSPPKSLTGIIDMHTHTHTKLLYSQIYTNTLHSAQPGPPRNITSVVVEDLYFYQHAIVTVTWDKPLC